MMKDEHSGKMVPISRDATGYGYREDYCSPSQMNREDNPLQMNNLSGSPVKVTHTRNNVTYVMIGEEVPMSLSNSRDTRHTAV